MRFGTLVHLGKREGIERTTPILHKNIDGRCFSSL